MISPERNLTVMIRGAMQFAVGLNPGRKAIEFSILNFNGEIQTLSWEKPEVKGNQDNVL